MGQGNFNQIIFGVKDFAFCDSDLEEKFEDIVRKIGDKEEIDFEISSEGGGEYFGIRLLGDNEMSGLGGELPQEVIPLDELSHFLIGIISNRVLKKAQGAWKKLQKEAKKIDVEVPGGVLLWAPDYD